MDNHKNLGRTKALLAQALSAAANSNSRLAVEARSHIRQAIKKIDEAANDQNRKKMLNAQFDSWWGDIQAGVAKQAMGSTTAEGTQKSLAQLDALINQEKDKLLELEKLSEPLPDEDDGQLLQG